MVRRDYRETTRTLEPKLRWPATLPLILKPRCELISVRHGSAPTIISDRDFRQEQSLVLTKLEQQAADRGRTLRQLLNILSASVPAFVSLVSGTIP
jgi:hypothetical protein